MEIERIAKSHREAWVKTVLVIVHSEPQRRAFIAGYNGYGLPNNSSAQMRENHALGQQVRAYLMENTDAEA